MTPFLDDPPGVQEGAVVILSAENDELSIFLVGA
jgi:hypothetical protein